MASNERLNAFIRDSFRSVWTLELLLLLRRAPAESWRRDQLVAALRASDAIVAKGLESLLASGLILVEAGGAARYAPANAELARLVDDAAAMYAVKPDAVRRLIVASSGSGLAAFSDAFRLRRD